jgi:tetratricopeptide (TPR) repeat protein
MKQLFTSLFLFFTYISVWGQPQSGLDHYIKAAQARKSGQYEQAIQEYDLALQHEPNNPFYLYKKGLCEFLLKRYPNASTTLTSVVKIQADYTPAYVLLAKIAAAANDSKKIIENLNMAAKYEKDNHKKINYKLYAMSRLIRDGDFQQAYEQVRQAYQISQEDSSVVYFYAKINNMLGKYAEAENTIQKFLPKIATQPAPAKAKYYYELGFAQFQQEQYEKAIANWKQAEFGVFKALIEKYSAKNFAAAALTYFRIYEDSIAHYYAEKALAIEKGHPNAHVILVQLAKRKVDHSVTLSQLQNAVQHESNPIKKKEMLLNIGEQQLQLGRYEGANQTFGQLLNMEQDNQKVLLLRLLIPYLQQNYRATITGVETTIKKIPDFNAQLPFIFLQAMAFKKSGQKDNAIKTFRRLLSTPLSAAATMEIDQLTQQINLDDDFNLCHIDPPENAK